MWFIILVITVILYTCGRRRVRATFYKLTIVTYIVVQCSFNARCSNMQAPIQTADKYAHTQIVKTKEYKTHSIQSSSLSFNVIQKAVIHMVSKKVNTNYKSVFWAFSWKQLKKSFHGCSVADYFWWTIQELQTICHWSFSFKEVLWDVFCPWMIWSQDFQNKLLYDWLYQWGMAKHIYFLIRYCVITGCLCIICLKIMLLSLKSS